MERASGARPGRILLENPTGTNRAESGPRRHRRRRGGPKRHAEPQRSGRRATGRRQVNARGLRAPCSETAKGATPGHSPSMRPSHARAAERTMPPCNATWRTHAPRAGEWRCSPHIRKAGLKSQGRAPRQGTPRRVAAALPPDSGHRTDALRHAGSGKRHGRPGPPVAAGDATARGVGVAARPREGAGAHERRGSGSAAGAAEPGPARIDRSRRRRAEDCPKAPGRRARRRAAKRPGTGLAAAEHDAASAGVAKLDEAPEKLQQSADELRSCQRVGVCHRAPTDRRRAGSDHARSRCEPARPARHHRRAAAAIRRGASAKPRQGPSSPRQIPYPSCRFRPATR